MNDEFYMRLALKEASRAAKMDEVPIGAVAVKDGIAIAAAHNMRETSNDPLGHAELLLLRKIVEERLIPGWRFGGTTIYVTCEPCVMCMGALLQARVDRLVFGCMDIKAGACGSLFDLSNDKRLNHRIEVTKGVMEKECAGVLSEFFGRIRERKSEVGSRKSDIRRLTSDFEFS